MLCSSPSRFCCCRANSIRDLIRTTLATKDGAMLEPKLRLAIADGAEGFAFS